MVKKIVKIFIVCCCALIFQSCYLIKQGVYLIRYNSRAQKVEKLLENPAIQAELRTFLQNVKEIRAFAFDSLGLVRNNNYTRYVSLDKDYLIDVVSAAEELSFKQHTWCFPFFGCFPLLGYYERKDAEREAHKLAKRGYDVVIDEVDAFSTLGFFSDPLYSFMQQYSEFALASMILHEQTHATIFLKNRVQFNEEMAVFVGTEGALAYIKGKYGEQSEHYRTTILIQHDRDAYYKQLRSVYEELKTIYEGNESREEKLREKQLCIDRFKKRLIDDYDQIFKTKRYRGIENATINNASLAIRMTYTHDLEMFYRLYAHNNDDLKATIHFLKTLKKKRGDPKEWIRKEIENQME